MGKLILILSSFYQCDIAITEHEISRLEMRECVAIADTLSANFLTQGERIERLNLAKAERLEMMTTGLKRFRAWEGENAALVEQLRFQARAKLMGDAPV